VYKNINAIESNCLHVSLRKIKMERFIKNNQIKPLKKTWYLNLSLKGKKIEKKFNIVL